MLLSRLMRFDEMPVFRCCFPHLAWMSDTAPYLSGR